MYIEGNTETRSRNKFYDAKDISNELLWAFVALVIQHAKRMHRILLSCMTYLCMPYFFTPLCYKRHEIVKRVI
jgi:hypothetical protein